jgi:aspartyl-tRNA(Asn)/glutamyl-tRNA(Gln) amidotransferase subunit B
VERAIEFGLAVNAHIAPHSVFARKNYFYPDLPKGYQISQYEQPLALRGKLAVDVDGSNRDIGITRVHMEEDAGKNLHGLGGESIVDLNRAGTPLIEIVGEPDLRSGSEAAEYLKRLRELLMFIGVCDGNLEQGSFRCDANVSVRRRGEAELGTRAELKNINSFRFVADAIDGEARRQIALIDRGERVRQQTRGYNAERRESYLLRDKENEAGYRYFPEPDLPPLVIDDALVSSLRAELPESPAAKRRRWIGALGLNVGSAGVLTSHPRIAAFFERASELSGEPVKAANFVQSEVLRDVKTAGLEAAFPVTPDQVAEILRLVDEGTISGKQAKELLAAVSHTDRSPREVVKERGMAVLSDESAIEGVARAVVDENAKQVAAYRSGKTAMFGFFVGQVMRQTGGSASPQVVNAVLKRLLDGDGGEAATGRVSAPPQTAPRTQKSPNHGGDPLAAPRPATPTAAGATEPRAGAAKPAAPLPAAPTDPGAAAATPDTIPYEAFAKLDLRVGLVVSAERVARKDKLLALRVDVGEAEPRRLVAGIALSFQPEALVGKRILVICNLEARVFSKDLVSHGMLLAAGPSEGLALATVTADLPPGTRVK